MRLGLIPGRLQTLRSLAILGLATPGLLFPVNFNTPRVYPLSRYSRIAASFELYAATSVVLGDFNGDGTADMVVAGYGHYGGQGCLAIFLGQAGIFEYAGDYNLPTGATSMVAGDFNKDGKLDLAVAAGTNVSILLGNGDGTFQPAVNYPAGVDPYALATADFSGNGNLDLAVTDNAESDVLILLGNGDGTFQPAVSYPVGDNPESIAVADFNADGKPDLAVANYGAGTVSILFEIGDGTFHRAVNHAIGENPISVAAGDFNGDGRPDLAVARQFADVEILLADGGGGFLPPVAYNAGPDPASVVVKDINRDGKLDLTVVNEYDADNLTGGASVSILEGNGNGTFQPPVAYGVAAEA